MPRKPKIRDAYTRDATFLTQLAWAVEQDPRRPEDWKRKIAKQLKSMAVELLNAPSGTNKKNQK